MAVLAFISDLIFILFPLFVLNYSETSIEKSKDVDVPQSSTLTVTSLVPIWVVSGGVPYILYSEALYDNQDGFVGTENVIASLLPSLMAN
jgi:hypothetical protein